MRAGRLTGVDLEPEQEGDSAGGRTDRGGARA